jgi:two-component system chemotaxis response regulator CheV
MQVNTDPKSYVGTGGNELRLLEYSCSSISFGINALKTSRIIPTPSSIVSIPNSHPAIKGIVSNLGVTIPIVDLGEYLGLSQASSGKGERPLKRVIVTEFFGKMYGFLVDSVNYIHTLQWTDVHNPGQESLNGGYTIGIIRFGAKKLISLLDYEKIILELSPEHINSKKISSEINEANLNKKILIVDDSSTIRNMLAIRFEGMGYPFVTAGSGDEALKIFKSQKDIALVVSDIEMPQKDGLTLTKEIKDLSPDTPVILYSSIGDIGMKERARHVKADHHVTKLNLEELFSKAAEFIAKKNN